MMRQRNVYFGATIVGALFLTAALFAQSKATGSSSGKGTPAKTTSAKAPAKAAPATAAKAGTAKAATPADFVAGRAVLDKYCAGCHNDKVKSGGLSMAGLDLSKIAQHAEVGEKIVVKLRAGMMPPVGMPRPDAKTYESLASTIEKQLDLAAALKPNLTAPGVHRLNRREYANAVRDLTLVEVDPAAVLPVDDAVFGFDNNAGALTSSPALIEAYISAASKISRAALGHEVGLQQKVYTAPSDYSQTSGAEGLMFGSRGG
jgi:mono/diheme cytochrome c family protein